MIVNNIEKEGCRVLLRAVGCCLSVFVLMLSNLQADEPKTNDSVKVVDAAKEETTSLVARARESVVVVTFTGRDGKQQGLGSGFVVDEAGLIATNRHVIGEARPITVQFANGKKYQVTEVRAADKKLDLAVLKIDADNLIPLPLRTKGMLQDGEPVLALGNPLGLKHSVVSGVVSGQRKVEGREMIQLAIPIEQGNSGGPVLNEKGEVIGLVTLKSLASQNLGYAVPASDLQLLLDKPNPVPMSQWLTIGKLDASKWTELFGASWQQRSGRINVQGTGDGFGGRALLLSKKAVPELPYEIAVEVKQDQVDGAAGLVFSSDGKYQHYGFYPSAGRIRLSKFNGPDVLSWQVLQELETPLLDPTGWNALKVRVEEKGVYCYLNGEKVIELPEAKAVEGSVGLAKFRNTTAHFKKFQLAKEVNSNLVTPKDKETILEIVNALRGESIPLEKSAKQLLPHADFTTTILEKEAKLLEQRAEQLRQLALEVHRKRVLADFEKEVNKENIDLYTAALHIAWLDNEELDVSSYQDELKQLVNTIQKRFTKEAAESEKFETMNQVLFKELGFHGSRTNYYHRSNSYLNEVLDDREGLPIALSVLYKEIAQGLGLKIEGVGLPGHFIAKFVPSKGESQLIDPFEGGKLLSREEAELIVISRSGKPLQEYHLEAQTERAILSRMLRNLMRIAQDEEAEQRMLGYTNLLLILDPQSTQDRWARALLSYRTSQWEQAIADLDWLDQQSPPVLNPRVVQQLRNSIERKRRGTQP